MPYLLIVICNSPMLKDLEGNNIMNKEKKNYQKLLRALIPTNLRREETLVLVLKCDLLIIKYDYLILTKFSLIYYKIKLLHIYIYY